jgi:hypothetical protein
MAVYVDDMQARFRRMIMCHMIADTTEELLAMADEIGVSRKWIQAKGTYTEHFDVCMKMRDRAVEAGAKEITQRELGMMLRTRRKRAVGELFDFAEALKRVKEGKKIARTGWNGKGMFVVYQKGYPTGIPINKNTAEATGIPEGTVCRFSPYLMMKAADDTFVPWLASQTDILADDWEVV